MTTHKNGSRSKPSMAGSMIGGGIAAVVGVVWMAMAVSAGAPVPFQLFGLLFVGMAIWAAVSGASRADRYRSAEETMHRHRRKLLEEIEEAQRRGG